MTVIKVYECCLHRKCYQKCFVTVCSVQGVLNLKQRCSYCYCCCCIEVHNSSGGGYEKISQYKTIHSVLKFAKLYHEKSFEIQLVETYVLWFSDYHCCLTPLGLAA